ncbi:hypothetical protein FF098_008110 [Parvularcula flava]|uniref:Orc1-like AAA ATPase domain-containing protein n=1 Tax=Aquisalinus luteolus TaxID=1566827 RepID=A0A8J3A365_9PROT|nr:hypothetical protein [Aquisalinus luteolus]NHK27862.1 hypothetical protein [Aquisalinus luteolus]GGH96729.1 hypothetical protein GCM10011355_16320 [Aquisalinus luteolus]
MFIGRKGELNTLQQLWEKAKAGSPQVAVLLAESGFGKTRLAQEFYNWLSLSEDQGGYWPDRLARDRKNLEVNPDPRDCGQADTDPSFLWWGLRISDPGRRNINAGGCLWSGLQVLKPHLASLEASFQGKSRRDARNQTLAMAAGGTLLTAIPVFGTFIGLGMTAYDIGKAAYDERQAAREEDEIRSHSGDETAKRAELDLTEQIALLLRAVVHKPPPGIEPKPVVLLIDDAQWSDKDASITAFVEDLLQKARTENWSIMVVITSWQREWAQWSSGGEQQHLASLSVAHGDCMTTLELDRLSGLEAMVRAAFPGLSDAQVTLFAERADGNPLFMDELVAEFAAKPRYFTGRDQLNPLTEEGERYVMECDLIDLIYERLCETSQSVQGSLAAASLQGVKFSRKLALAVAEKLALPEPDAGLDAAENPYAFVSSSLMDKQEFRTRLYQEAARQRLQDLVDEAQAQEALRAVREAAMGISTETAEDAELEVLLDLAIAEGGEAFRDVIEVAHMAVLRLEHRDAYRESDALARSVLDQFDPEKVVIDPHSIYGLDKMLGVILGMGRAGYAIGWYRAMMPQILKEDPGADVFMNHFDRAHYLQRYGTALMKAGQLDEAETVLKQSIQLARTEMAGLPEAAFNHKIIISCKEMTKLLFQKGEITGAEQFAREALSYSREYYKEKGTFSNRRGLLEAIGILCDIENSKHNHEGVGTLIPELMTHAGELFEQTQDMTDRQNLSAALERAGDYYLAVGKRELAKGHFEESLAHSRFIAEKRVTPIAQRMPVAALGRLGRIALEDRAFDVARELFDDNLRIAQRLYDWVGDAGARRDLVIALQQTASLEAAQGNSSVAIGIFKQSLDHAQVLFDMNPAPDSASSVIISAMQLRNLYFKQFKFISMFDTIKLIMRYYPYLE